MRVAEGHLDLSRKLNESIRLSNETKDKMEIHDLKMTYYDVEMSRLALAK